MKYFLDTEFLENGRTIDLISVALVAESNAMFYGVHSRMPRERIREDKWLMDNVMPNLHGTHIEGLKGFYGRKEFLRDGILEFLKDDPAPEFWADYSAYDWVVFCQIFGRMMDLPSHFPMFCRDIQQAKESVGHEGPFKYVNPRPHHALWDAIECKERYAELREWWEEIQ